MAHRWRSKNQVERLERCALYELCVALVLLKSFEVSALDTCPQTYTGLTLCVCVCACVCVDIEKMTDSKLDTDTLSMYGGF